MISQAKEKNVPFSRELLAHWKELKVQQVDSSHEGQSLRKEKWDDVLYFKAQEALMLTLHQPKVLPEMASKNCQWSGSSEAFISPAEIWTLKL